MKLLSSVVLFLLLFSTAVAAFTLSNPHYRIEGVISGGGGMEAKADMSVPLESNTGKYQLYVSVAQPATTGYDTAVEYDPGNAEFSGTLQSATGQYKMCLGVFCTDTFSTPYSLIVSGIVEYDYGDPVANSEASLIVRYGKAKYENAVTTGPNGEFSAKLAIPEFIADKRLNPTGEFQIQVYANARVEALYNCYYCLDESATNTGTCTNRGCSY